MWATVIGCLLLAGSAFLTISAWLTPVPQVFVLAAALAPWAILSYALGVLIFVVGASRRIVKLAVAALAIAGLGVHAYWMAPFFTGPTPSAAPHLRVVQLNTNQGHADPDEIKALLTKTNPDVFVMAEATPTLVQDLIDNGSVGPGGVVPNLGEVPAELLRGTVTYARFPITMQKSVDVSDGAYLFRVAAPQPFSLISLHTAEPLVAYDNWKTDYETVLPLIEQTKGARLVVGDFNLTDFNAPMRELLGTGLRDAAEQANSGWQPTWPSGRSPLGILMIDHVLMSKEFAATKTRTIGVPGSDHYALVTDLARP